MFIVIIGSVCSGKTQVLEYLKTNHGFEEIKIDTNAGDNGDGQSWTNDRGMKFNDIQALTDFVTVNWRTRYVTRGITSISDLEAISRRPFVLLVGIEAPILQRFQRFKEKRGSEKTLDEFVTICDEYLFKPESHDNFNRIIREILKKCHVNLNNNYNTKSELYKYLDSVKLDDDERLRPSWDAYFMMLAELASHRSNCMKRRVGCILVQNKKIIATGYNGTPMGLKNCNEGGCERCNLGTKCGQSLDDCRCIHAEENALLEAGRSRIGEGTSILYCNTCPCLGCAKKIVQAGVKLVVYSMSYGMDDKTAQMFDEGNITLRQYKPLY